MSPRAGLDAAQIVAEAVEIADEQGPEAITLAAVARRLNVQSPSLFNHIKGLPELKRQIALYGLAKLYEALKSAAVNKRGKEAFVALSLAYVHFTREHPGLYELTLRAPDPNDVEVNKLSENIMRLMKDILAVYSLTEEETIHAIRALRSILHGFASLEQKQAFGLAIDVNDSLQLLLEGYAAMVAQLGTSHNRSGMQ